jgi:hypothetical protein
MSCRAACFVPADAQRVGAVTCADCAAGSLTVFYTSEDKQTHLCQACFESRIALGQAKEAPR